MIADALADLHGLTAEQPAALQVLVLALVGAVPFLEAHLAAALGVVVGVHPVLAVAAGAAGNYASVLLAAWLARRARGAVRARRGSPAPGEGTADDAIESAGAVDHADLADAADAPDGGSRPARPAASVPGMSPQRVGRLRSILEAWGVPVACLAVPAVLPTQAAAATLIGLGCPPRQVLGWMALSVVGWGTVYAVLAGLGVAVLT